MTINEAIAKLQAAADIAAGADCHMAQIRVMDAWAIADILKKKRTRRLTFMGLLTARSEPFYIVTKDAQLDCWAFYSGYMEAKKIFLFRDCDGHLNDFREQDYGKTWLCFTGEVTDKMWEEIEWDES